MNASTLAPNNQATGAIAAQAVQFGIPVNSALQSQGFAASTPGNTPLDSCVASCQQQFPNNPNQISQCIANCTLAASNPVTATQTIVGNAFSNFVASIIANVQNAFPRVGLFLFAIILTVAGVWLLVKQ